MSIHLNPTIIDGTRQPLPVGTRISYCNLYGTVIEDFGGDTLVVQVDGESTREKWFWYLDGIECKIVSFPTTKKYTAIYTHRVGYSNNSITKMIRFEQKEGERIMDAVNRTGHESGLDYDIDDAIVYIFEGHPKLEGEK